MEPTVLGLECRFVIVLFSVSLATFDVRERVVEPKVGQFYISRIFIFRKVYAAQFQFN